MRLVPYVEADRAEWNRACEASCEAWLFHRHEWVEIEIQQRGLESVGFAVASPSGSIVGVMPLYRETIPLGAFCETLVHSGLHRHAGLALVDGLSRAERGAARSLAMQAVFAAARAAGADRIQLSVQNLAPASLGPTREEVPFWVSEHGFFLGVGVGPNGICPAPGLSTLAADQVVALDDADEVELFARLEDSCRRAVRKAQRSGVITEWAAPESAAGIYCRLAARSAERTGETLARPAYYEAVLGLPPIGTAARLLVALHEGTEVGALVLLAAKSSLHFLAGASDPAALSLRPNDLLHWTAIAFGRALGLRRYRLGPFFPELPRSWPVATVSRFKAKFGARSIPILQGSFFLRPEKYEMLARDHLAALREAALERVPRVSAVFAAPRHPIEVGLDGTRGRDFEVVLRGYGALDLPLRFSADAATRADARARILFVDPATKERPGGIQVVPAAPGRSYFEASRRSKAPIYRALLPHAVFQGPALRPLWVDAEGRASLAWVGQGPAQTLLVGFDVADEIVRWRQGDPARTTDDAPRARLGFGFERPNYLFEHQLDSERPTLPWADHLGFALAECLCELARWPLIEPLPGGLRGLVLFTGDDDEAYLERYHEQLRLIGDLPVTYYLVPKTRHTGETLGRLPANVELGLHIDALDRPADYAQTCREQTHFLRGLTGRACRTLRNHGYLNDGYLGHLPAWEENAIGLDLNLPGVDGTVLNGSLLPLRLRRPDGTWSQHYSLLTAFGDGMLQALGLGQWQAGRKIRALVRQIEAARPGVLVFNFHPQNVPGTRRLHRAVRRLAKRRGWAALGAEGYLAWLELLQELRIDLSGGSFRLRSARAAQGLVLRVPVGGSWQRVEIPPFRGEMRVPEGAPPAASVAGS
jgi:hypothetical protein